MIPYFNFFFIFKKVTQFLLLHLYILKGVTKIVVSQKSLLCSVTALVLSAMCFPLLNAELQSCLALTEPGEGQREL